MMSFSFDSNGRRWGLVLVAAGLTIVVASCEDDAEGTLSGASGEEAGSEGGASQALGGTGPGASGAAGCGAAFFPECCATPGGLPCKGLDEAECSAASFCLPVTGAPWAAGDKHPSLITGAAGARPELSFIGCVSVCNSASEDDFKCVADPSLPERCFWTSSLIPDGWIRFIDCVDIPEGSCEPEP